MRRRCARGGVLQNLSLSLSLFFYCKGIIPKVILGACYEKHTERTKKKERREKHDEIEKAENERPPTLVSCGWLLVADLSLPFSSQI